jgi:predicted MFS family arabinose efflux permease
MNSSIHSYMVLAYTDTESVSLNVGFYYMANAAGRLLGTVLSGALFMLGGLQACLWSSAILVALAAAVSTHLPPPPRQLSPK